MSRQLLLQRVPDTVSHSIANFTVNVFTSSPRVRRRRPSRSPDRHGHQIGRPCLGHGIRFRRRIEHGVTAVIPGYGSGRLARRRSSV